MSFNRSIIVVQLLAWICIAGCIEEIEREPTAGGTGVGCPVDVPAPGEHCQTTQMACTYKRNGPCPPNPDQIRQCIDGKWVASVPTIACGPFPRADAEDAGSD
jgi:hypothetical protein